MVVFSTQCPLPLEAEAVGAGEEPQPDRAADQDLVPEPQDEEQEEQPKTAAGAQRAERTELLLGLQRGKRGRRRRGRLSPRRRPRGSRGGGRRAPPRLPQMTILERGAARREPSEQQAPRPAGPSPRPESSPGRRATAKLDRVSEGRRCRLVEHSSEEANSFPLSCRSFHETWRKRKRNTEYTDTQMRKMQERDHCERRSRVHLCRPPSPSRPTIISARTTKGRY